MKNTLTAGLAAATFAFGGAVAQTTPPGANTTTPPAVIMPQPAVRTPADQNTGATTPNVGIVGGGITMERARSLIGTDLIGADDRKTGEIDNLLADGTGRIRGAVIEWGGFLGLGQKQAVVPIEDIRLGATDNDKARLTLTRAQLEQLPAFDKDKLAEYQTRFGWQNLRTVR
jgi:hypothetical protein